MLLLFRAPRKSLNTTAKYISVEKMTESGQKEKEQGNTQLAGVNASAKTYEGIEKIFLRAEHARHKEHAEEVLSELVRREIQPLLGDGFLDYSQEYDDFPLYVEWYDFDQDGEFVWAGTLQYFIHYIAQDGRVLTDQELAHEIEEIRKDLLARMKELEERGKEVEKND